MFSSRQILFNKSDQLSLNINNIEVLGSSTLRYRFKNFPIGAPFSIIRMDGANHVLFPFAITGRPEYPNCYKTDIDKLTYYKNSISGIISSKRDKDVVIDHEVIKTEDKINSEFINNNKIPKFVKDIGPISFYVENINLISNFLDDIFNLYKYKISLECYTISDSITTLSKIDNIYAIVSFFDIKHFIPIFDNKHVDGMGITVKLGHEKNINYVGALTIIVSNYKRNLFYIDGVYIKPPPHEIKKGEYTSVLSNIIKSRIVNKKLLKVEPEKNKGIDKKNMNSGVGISCNAIWNSDCYQIRPNSITSNLNTASTANTYYWR